MYAVGKLGSYISRGVVTVAAPFHPFGGAVDIVVVEQEDGSFKSSPWYVQFGKFQGVLKAREKVVSINVNGVDADFLMYLDSRGGAYFLREVDGEDDISETETDSWGDTAEGVSGIRRPTKIMSSNYDLQRSKLVSEFGAGNAKIVTRSTSTGPRILGFVFGQRSEKENDSLQQENVVGKDRKASLERAEIAADLLEVRWTTSLATRKQKKENVSCISDQQSSVNEGIKTSKTDSSMLPHSNGSHDNSSSSDYVNDAGDSAIPLSTVPENFMESFSLEEKHFEFSVVSESSVGSNIGNSGIFQSDEGADSFGSGSIGSNSFVERSGELKFDALSSGDEHSTSFQILQADNGSGIDCETSVSFVERLDSFNGESSENSAFACSVSGKMNDPVNPEFSSTIIACEMDKNIENLKDNDPCIFVDGSKSGVAPDDVETVLQTKVEVILDCKTSQGPVKLVEELVVDQVTPHQEPSLTDSFLIEEATTAALNLIENFRSEAHCISPPPSVSLVSENSEGDQLLSSDSESSEPNIVLTTGSTSSNSTSNERNFHGFGEKLNEAHIFYSDLDESEAPRTMDIEATPLDSLEAENNPKSYGSTEMRDKSHSFTGELIQEEMSNDHSSCPEISRTTSSPVSIAGAHDQVDQITQTADSFSSSCSDGVVMNPQDVNHTVIRSMDSSLDSMMLVSGDLPTISENGTHEQMSVELKELLSDPAVEISLCRHLLHEGMGYEVAAHAFDSEKVDVEKFVSLGPDFLKNDKVVVRIGGLYFPWDAALPIISAIGTPRGEQLLEPKGMINVQEVEKMIERNPKQSTDSGNGTWRLWPFKKTKSINRKNSVVVDANGSQRGPAGNTPTPEPETIKRRLVRAKTPTSEQLASLNLKEGRNVVTFTFSTSMLGEQKVDARIFLWKWNARIVISDVDGTITKSDVLGQFMPMVGVDWSQTGVTHLFSAIKENGYELLFLSARAISQASVTRQFLFNLKQDGIALPEGPVVISPDGLFPSLFREVIRRAPHEFKIACLEDIKALFPPDHSPFYAGFGNRDTDEVSYVKVGIPKGKCFIINPKGEVAVSSRVATKSYTSLHELVNEMFPDPSSVPLDEKEDYNSWNFWRLPPPSIA